MSEEEKWESREERRSPSLNLKIPGIGEINVRGMTVMVALTFAVSSVTAALLYMHLHGRDRHDAALEKALTAVASAQRMTACIVSLPQDQREAQFREPNSFCSRMADLRIVRRQPRGDFDQ